MPFNSALSGLQAASSALKVHGNNIANASTTGFKASREEFRDVFAAGSLGSSANAIGTGVKLTSVQQQFTQGNIVTANTSLDLAINGSGFFILDKDGSKLYSRNGAFAVDKEGNIANSQRQKLIGFLTDDNNNITGAQGPLSIKNTSIDPKATEAVDVTINLNADENPKLAKFKTGFTPDNPPDSSTFNNSSSVPIFDSLGKQHIMTMYYVKAPAERTWNVYIGVDGVDVTTKAEPLPTITPPQTSASYPTNKLACPFTIVFDENGKFVVNNASSPPEYYGNNVNGKTVYTPDLTENKPTTGSASLTAEEATLSPGDLLINGIPIDIGDSKDTVSTFAPQAGATAIAEAINKKKDLHKVTADVASAKTSINFGAISNSGGVDINLANNMLVINGIQITGLVQNASSGDDLAALITAQVPEVSATYAASGNELTLTATDNRNIHVTTDGTSGLIFGSHITTPTDPSAVLQRAPITLSIDDNQGITISGNNPKLAGLIPVNSKTTVGGIFQNNSDNVSIAYSPGTGASSPQNITLDISNSSLFASPFSVTALTQDGYSTGRLTGVEVDPEGIITARFGNGRSQQLGQVALANFRNPQGLQAYGDTSWVETYSSGVALLGAPGTSDLGLIQSGSLEDSNVQLTNELVSLIIGQRNFQANAQTIRTADAVTQTIINIR